MQRMIVLSLLIISGCSPANEPAEQAGKAKTATEKTAPEKTANKSPLPKVSQKSVRWELRRGERYFRLNGVPTLVLGRNPIGTIEQFQEAFRHGAANGERLVRIHITYGQKSKPGEVDEAWSKRWEQVFDMAAKNGLGVIPVFGVWAEWNDGSKNETWHTWDKSIFNAKNGGPAQSPRELFDDTPCRKQWLAWLEAMVKRWRGRKEIVAWEIFSELDLLTGSTEPRAAEFVQAASAVIRRADSESRPITVSLAGINEWPKVFSLDAVDFIQIHPYATNRRYGGNLCDMILATMHARLRRYKKPVLIGESGLDARPPRMTLTVSKRASIGIRQAIWAGAVSGAMNARMLWWEDGYGRYEGAANIIAKYHAASAPVQRFVAGVDYTGFRRVAAKTSRQLRGAALGNRRIILCWFRDIRCGAPNWPMRVVSGSSVTLAIGQSADWEAQYYETATGKVIGERSLKSVDGQLAVPLPDFEGSIGIKLRRKDTQ